ncbi:hypothetical protein Golob_010295 [Gossypium lobatum]|uniref:RNase H type-1 domain-containing protein n=1 Tax=Gossypium lobatum TaxID=34289 RepID=A0A7J8MKZ1_9ROSI|nr:hypothetical protein [Gossypium lobatum]
MDISWAEVEAFKVGLKLAKSLNVGRLIVESDSTMLVNAVNKRRQDITILGQCIRSELDALSSFESVQVKWINHNSNYVADSLYKLTIKNENDLYFDMEYLMDIHNIIIRDSIN